jgi:hypothetical protein
MSVNVLYQIMYITPTVLMTSENPRRATSAVR